MNTISEDEEAFRFSADVTCCMIEKLQSIYTMGYSGAVGRRFSSWL